MHKIFKTVTVALFTLFVGLAFFATPVLAEDSEVNTITEGTDSIQAAPVSNYEEITNSTVSIPFETKRVNNPDLPVGEEIIHQHGVQGLKTTKLKTVFDAEWNIISEEIVSDVVTKQPVDHIIHVGTKVATPEKPVVDKPVVEVTPKPDTGNGNSGSGNTNSGNTSGNTDSSNTVVDWTYEETKEKVERTYAEKPSSNTNANNSNGNSTTPAAPAPGGLGLGQISDTDVSIHEVEEVVQDEEETLVVNDEENATTDNDVEAASADEGLEPVQTGNNNEDNMQSIVFAFVSIILLVGIIISRNLYVNNHTFRNK